MSPNEMMNREKKAVKLAAVLFKVGATAEDVVNASREDWLRFAEAASLMFGEHTNPPNKINPKPTVDAVLALLARAYADEADKSERRAELKWEAAQEYAGNRCPPRE